MRQVEVFVKGPGAGREQAIRSLQAAGLEVTAITDVTPIPQTAAARPSAAGSRGKTEKWHDTAVPFPACAGARA